MKLENSKTKNKRNKIIATGLAVTAVSCTFLLFVKGATTYSNKVEREKEIKSLLNAKDISSDISSDISTKVVKDTDREVQGYDGQYELIDTYSSESKKTLKAKDYIKEINTSKPRNNGICISQGAEINHTDDDTELLARLVNSEAGDQPYAGKLAVANVVINRCRKQGKDLKDIIYATNQFDGVSTRWFNIEPNAESIQAAEDTLSGKSILGNAYYFADLNICNAPDWANKDKFICRIGGHWFFKE